MLEYMTYRDPSQIRSTSYSLVGLTVVVFVAVGWLLLSFLGQIRDQIECSTSTPDVPMETCDDHDQP